MKKQPALLPIALAGLCAVSFRLHAADPVPPKPPGGDAVPPPAADTSAPKSDGERRGPGGGPGGRMNPEERLKMMTEKLGLTQEQQDKIKAIQEKNVPQIREIMTKGRDNVTEADKEKVRELMKSQMEEIGAILTPEQREKMRTLRPGGPGGDRKPGEGRPKRGDGK